MKSLMKTMVIAVSLMVGLLFGQGAWAIGRGGGLTGEGGDTGAWTLDVTPLDLQGFTGNEPIETFTGTVTAVEKMAGVSDGVQLVLRDEYGQYVHDPYGP